MKFMQILGACALVLAIATACKRGPEATPETAPAATPASESNPVDVSAAVESTPATDSGSATIDTRTLAGKFGDGESVLELRADGSYLQTLQVGGDVISTDGNWNAIDGDGLLLDPNSKSAEDVRFQVVSNDELRNADGTRTFRRVAGR